MPPLLPAYFSVGHGPAVIMLHCSLSSKNQWRGLSSLLAAGYRAVALDLYGYGDTAMPPAGTSFSLRDEAMLVQALAEELLPQQPFHLIGHSYGGATALAYCHYFPGRVKSLTLFEPVSFHILEPDDEALRPVRAMVRELDRELAAARPGHAAQTFVDYWGGAGTFAAYPARVQKDFARRTEKLLLDFTALTETPISLGDYGDLKVPVTLIAGRNSQHPALHVAETLSQALPECKTVWVETGHMGPVTDPDIVNPVILTSLR
jgi:pimeloyl-ACP methyl ester carboxylesterase